jgi:hypothetical protein
MGAAELYRRRGDSRGNADCDDLEEGGGGGAVNGKKVGKWKGGFANVGKWKGKRVGKWEGKKV